MLLSVILCTHQEWSNLNGAKYVFLKVLFLSVRLVLKSEHLKDSITGHHCFTSKRFDNLHAHILGCAFDVLLNRSFFLFSSPFFSLFYLFILFCSLFILLFPSSTFPFLRSFFIFYPSSFLLCLLLIFLLLPFPSSSLPPPLFPLSSSPSSFSSFFHHLLF